MQDHNDIYSIVERLRMLEEGLDKNQRSVNQLSATFKPKTVAVLTAKTDPKNPMAGKLVGGCEESEELDEATVAEDILDKVKQSFADYLKNVADEIKQDSDLKDKKKDDTDLKKKDKMDRDLVTKESVAEHGTNLPESSLIKTVTNECGLWEVHGDERTGFEIRHGNRKLPTRFKNLDEAELALEMFNARQRRQDEAQDYIDEA
jgi:hypothetical protein